MFTHSFLSCPRSTITKALYLFSALVVGAVLKGVEPHGVASPSDFMQRIEDETQMWWAEGFPGHTPAAPWLRVVQTGTYVMALNTETMRIPHFGAVA